MSGPFVYELASVHAAVEAAYPGHPQGLHAVPFYLVIGEPGSGRSTALRGMQLTWPSGDGRLRISVPQQQCTYWLASEALFIEPEANVLGVRRNPELLQQLCDGLRTMRPREPIDGILLVINIAEFIDLDERALDEYANRLRKYLVEVAQTLRADVPSYVVLTRYDTLWGFAEVFQWTADRQREDPWGFTLPHNVDNQNSLPSIKQELEGLNARLESFCLHRLLSEDPPEYRVRAFQHLTEVRALKEKLFQLFGVLAMTSSFERAPWIRSVAIGSAVPGMGDRPRAGTIRFMNMGLSLPPPGGAATRPGGLPVHAFMKTVVLPERDLVPTRTRWRDDNFFLIGLIIAILLAVSAPITELVLSLIGK